MPLAVGVPLMIIVFADQVAFTPAGNPVYAPIPVAPVVVWVIFVKGVLIHKVGVLDAALAVFAAVTIIVPVVVAGGQPPVVVTV